MKRFGLLTFTALLAPAIASAQVQTAPLPTPDEPLTRADRSERQTGMVTFGEAGGRQVIIRSFEPTTVLSSDYTVDFEALAKKPTPKSWAGKDAGVLLVIDSDAHGPETMENVRWGVATARRAWLGPEDVANTRPWPELRKLRKGGR